MPSTHGYKIIQGEDGNWYIHDENDNPVDGPFVTWDQADQEARRLPPRTQPEPSTPDQPKKPIRPVRPKLNDEGPGP